MYWVFNNLLLTFVFNDFYFLVMLILNMIYAV
jgi:hypothetical protein